MKLPIAIAACLLMLSACVSKKKFLNEVAEKEGFSKVAVQLTNDLQQEQLNSQSLDSRNRILRDSLQRVQNDLATFARRNETLTREVNTLTEEIVTLKQRYDIAVQEQQLAGEKRDQALQQIQQQSNFNHQVITELYAKLEAIL